MAQARRPTDRMPSKEAMLERARQLDLRRQEQIANQAKIINRLVEVNVMYEHEMDRIAALGLDTKAGTWATQALDKAAEINKKHREQNKEKQDG